jgi:uncharacterized integral membrane protein
MRLKSAAQPSDSPAAAVTPPTVGLNDEPPAASAPKRDAGQAAPESRIGETRGEHYRRMAHRTRLHGYAFVAVALFAFLVALAASNTARVKVSWVFGSSHVALVWLVLFAAILGWLLGILIAAAFRWRTRAPRR